MRFRAATPRSTWSSTLPARSAASRRTTGRPFSGEELKAEIDAHNRASLKLYEHLLESGVCREQARGVLPQNMMVTFWGTVDLGNLLHFLELRDSDHAQSEIREYAKAIKTLIKPIVPNVAAYFTKKGQEW